MAIDQAFCDILYVVVLEGAKMAIDQAFCDRCGSAGRS